MWAVDGKQGIDKYWPNAEGILDPSCVAPLISPHLACICMMLGVQVTTGMVWGIFLHSIIKLGDEFEYL